MASTPGVHGLSIDRTSAKVYIARVIGGSNDPNAQDIAEECLRRGFFDWQSEKDWEFLLKDNTGNFTVEGVTLTNSSATISPPNPSDFDGVNIGITVTDDQGKIPANTTVLSYSRNLDGSIASITLSATPTGNVTAILTFGGTIPVLSGVTDYNLPTDFYKHYGVRVTSTLKWPLTFVRPRDWNKVTLDQNTQGPPELYTIFNTSSPLSQNKSTYRLRILRTPKNPDVMKVEYYRKFNPLSDPLDMDGAYLYQFLDYCRGLAVLTKRGFDDVQSSMTLASTGLEKSKIADEMVTEDNDIYMKTQMEMGILMRQTWRNGEFFADYGY